MGVVDTTYLERKILIEKSVEFQLGLLARLPQMSSQEFKGGGVIISN